MRDETNQIPADTYLVSWIPLSSNFTKAKYWSSVPGRHRGCYVTSSPPRYCFLCPILKWQIPRFERFLARPPSKFSLMRNLETLELDSGTGKDIGKCYTRAMALVTKFISLHKVKLCWKTDLAAQSRIPTGFKGFFKGVSLCGPTGLEKLIVQFN